MKLVGNSKSRKTKTFFILDEGQEVGHISYYKRVAADISLRSFEYSDGGRPKTPIFLVRAHSSYERLTNETLLQGMLDQLEDLMYSHNLKNVAVIISEEYVDQYDSYGYQAIAHSEKHKEYLVIKYLHKTMQVQKTILVQEE